LRFEDNEVTSFHHYHYGLARWSSLISLFIFGVTLEAINDPKELSAIPLRPLDFVTYVLIALAIFS
jgi:hypothetical protein